MRRTNCTLIKFQMKFDTDKIVIIFQKKGDEKIGNHKIKKRNRTNERSMQSCGYCIPRTRKTY